MNNLRICIASVFWLTFMHIATAQQNVILTKNRNIVASFNFDKNKKLFLVIKNISNENILLATDIDSLIRIGLQGFPQNAAIQFRSKDKKLIELKDQAKNGWLYPNLYNSKLDFKIVDGKFKNNVDDAFGNLLVANNSSTSRPINYNTGLKFVSSELRSANDFRVMWEIKIKDDGIVIKKEIVSDWFQYESIL